MLASTHRLPLRQLKDFFTTARRHHSQFFTLFYRQGSGSSRGAVIVAKKVASLATERNLWKRRLRQALLPFLKKSSGLELVVAAKKTILQSSFVEVKKELERLFAKLVA